MLQRDSTLAVLQRKPEMDAAAVVQAAWGALMIEQCWLTAGEAAASSCRHGSSFLELPLPAWDACASSRAHLHLDILAPVRTWQVCLPFSTLVTHQSEVLRCQARACLLVIPLVLVQKLLPA